MEIIDLEMIPGGPKKTCHASQFDNGRVIRFNLKENGQPFALSGTETVQAIIRKPDGTEKTVNIANTASTYVDLITAEDTCDLAGVNHCEMSITEDGEDLGSGNFDMKVEEDAYGAGDVTVGEASGEIASFETDIKDDLIECVCEINPEQDLHGYDHPWPGGAGKNKIDNKHFTHGLPSQTIDDDYSNIITSTRYAYFDFNGINQPFTISAAVIDSNYFDYIAIYGYINNKLAILKTTDPALPPVTYSDFINCEKMRVCIGAVGGYIVPEDLTEAGSIQLEEGTQATAYEPYENICPISGFTKTDIIRAGVNLWDEEIRNGYYNNSGVFYELASSIANKNPIPVNPNTTYYCHVGASYQFFVFTYDKDGNFISRITTAKNATFTTPANCAYIGWCNGYGEGGTYANNISINSDSTDTDYHPAEIIKKTINFGQTIYKGQLNVTKGQGESDYGAVDMGTLNWYRDGSQRFVAPVNGIKPPTIPREYATGLMTEILKPDRSPIGGAVIDGTIARFENGNVYAYCFAYQTAADFKTAMSGKLLIFEKATSDSIQATPKNIETEVGKNNLYHTANGDTAVKFYIRA